MWLAVASSAFHWNGKWCAVPFVLFVGKFGYTVVGGVVVAKEVGVVYAIKLH